MFKKFIIYLTLIITIIFILQEKGISDNNIRFNPVELFYGIYWGPFKIGESKIKITSQKYEAIVYSVGLGKIFFPFYAKWETRIDKNGYPLEVYIYSKERGKERKKLIKFDKKQEIVIYQKLLPDKKKPEIVSVRFPVYDELSSFITSFFINYKKVKETCLPVYIKKSKDLICLRVKKETTCKINDKLQKCIKISVKLPSKSELLKRTSQVEMELLEKEKYPVKIKGKLPLLGHLVGKLYKISPLNHHVKLISSANKGI